MQEHQVSDQQLWSGDQVFNWKQLWVVLKKDERVWVRQIDLYLYCMVVDLEEIILEKHI